MCGPSTKWCCFKRIVKAKKKETPPLKQQPCRLSSRKFKTPFHPLLGIRLCFEMPRTRVIGASAPPPLTTNHGVRPGTC
ncbi:hypothetical protein V6Z11_A07G143500 [Gossypium hirsutum]